MPKPSESRLSVVKGSPESAINYAPAGPILREHMLSNDYCQNLIGPLGSAKTTNNIIKMVRYWSLGPIDPTDGKRHFRWAAIRNTYTDLINTTIKDFLEMVEPLKIGTFAAAEMGKGSPAFKARFIAADGIETVGDVIFLAFDVPKDIRKARGLRLSGVWFNEFKELAKANVDMVMSRLRRFRPDLFNANPECWYGALTDSNAPDADHWLAKLVELKPAGWWFGIQPGAVIYKGGQFRINPQAENLKVVSEQYYLDQMPGKDEYWIRQNLGNEFVYYSDGLPVHPDYNQRLHHVEYEIDPLPGISLHLGFDFGRTPAMLVWQKQPTGRWFAIDELIGVNTSAKPFGKACKRFLNERYEGFSHIATGDPSGDAGGQATDDTCFQMLAAGGIDAMPAPTNEFKVRKEALDGLLRENIGGEPAILVSARCKTFHKGLSGAYQFKRVQVANEQRYHNEPVKGPESHVVEAGHYGLLGAGEGIGLTSSEWKAEYDSIERDYGGWRPNPAYFE